MAGLPRQLFFLVFRQNTGRSLRLFRSWLRLEAANGRAELFFHRPDRAAARPVFDYFTSLRFTFSGITFLATSG